MWILNWIRNLFRSGSADVEPDHDAALEEEMLDDEDDEDDEDEA
jgi:hypothetical protein